MNRETITLPRSVVEQALEALKYERDANNPLDWHHDKTMTALRAALEQPDVRIPTSVPGGWKLVPVKPTEDMLNSVAWPGCAATDWEHMLAAAPQPPVVKESLTTDPDQSDSTASAYQRGYLDGMAKGRRDAAMDAEEDQQPVAWLFRDANNYKIWFLEKTSTPTGYRGEWIKTPLYARPQPKREPPVEQELAIYPEEAFDMGLEAIPYYTHPQNLSCKSTQARLATLWGYEKPQPPRQPLTDGEVKMLIPDGDEWKYEVGFAEATEFARAIERAHGIGGDA